MPASYEARTYKIGDLIGEYETRSIVLPRFQRGFSWESSQISSFWSDLVSFLSNYKNSGFTATYFLGPVVVRETSSEIILLDGQQRLATATILLSAIRNLARKLNDPTTNNGHDLARDVQRDLIEKENSTTKKYSFQLSELDEPYFVLAIKANIPTNPEPKPRLRSHKLIKTAFNYFDLQLAQIVQGKSSEDAVKNLKEIVDVLTKGVIVVAIRVEQEEDAYYIFETLNDRGLNLSVPDLLLNLLMRRSSNQDTLRTHWNNMLTTLGQRDISRFLRHMWMSRFGDLKARGLFTEIKNKIETENQVSLDFAEACASECDDYVSIIDVSNKLPQESILYVEGITRYFRITSAYPLLLSGKRCLNEQDFTRLSKSIVAIVVRYGIFGNLNPAYLESAFYEGARELRGQKLTGANSSRCFQAAKDKLAAINPTDKLVKESGLEISLDRKPALWIMTEIANSMQSKTRVVSLDDANLEHIFPQNAGSNWPNRNDLDPYLWNIGNLTILETKINRQAGNKSFPDKLANHYSSSDVVMTKDLNLYAQWTLTELQKRTQDMMDKVVQIWPGP